MLEYKEFVDELKAKIIENMSPDFKEGFEVMVTNKEVEGKDIVQEVLYLKSDKELPNFEAPSLALMPLYETKYKRELEGDIDKTIKFIARLYDEIYRKRYAESLNIRSNVKVENTKAATHIASDIFFIVENYEKVKESLDGITHKVIGENVLIANCVNDLETDSVSYEPVTEEIRKELKMDEIQVLSQGLKNTNKLFPPKLEKLQFGQYYLSNAIGVFGATSAFLPEGPIAELSEKTDKNVLIIPASKDGCIIEPVEHDQITKEFIEDVCNELKEFGIKNDKNEVLSEKPMLYDRKAKKLITDMSSMSENNKKRFGHLK